MLLLSSHGKKNNMASKQELIDAINRVVTKQQSKVSTLTNSDVNEIKTARDNAINTLNALETQGVNVKQAILHVDSILEQAKSIRDRGNN